MASLTEISIISRKGIRYGIYLLIFLLIARTLFGGAKAVYLRLFPPQLPEPDSPYGQLVSLPFPVKNDAETARIESANYTLETAQGTLPVLANQLPVYEMPPIPQNINALEDAKRKVSLMDFDAQAGQPTLESTPNVYRFPKKNVPASLTMNIVTGIFSIYYDLTQDPTLLNGVPLNEETAKQQVTSFLNSATILPDDLKNGRMTHQFYRSDGVSFTPVDSLSEANFIKVNAFRKNFGPNDGFTSVTPEMPEANVWFMMGPNIRQTVLAEFHYYPIDAGRFGAYPLKSSEKAWEDLKAGDAFIVDASTIPQNGDVVIRNVYLAYYDSGQYQPYYQPVVVFEGDNGFLAYVPAVTDEFYGKEGSI